MMWTPRAHNPYKSRALHLDAFRVIGAGAAHIAEVLVDEWLAANTTRFISREPVQDGELEQFGLRRRAAPRLQLARRPHSWLGDLAARVRSPEARQNLLRLAYLLVETDLARLDVTRRSVSKLQSSAEFDPNDCTHNSSQTVP